MHFDEYLVKRTYYLPKETSNQCCWEACAYHGHTSQKRGGLNSLRGEKKKLCPFLYFCTPLKVDHDSSLAFRILAGNPKTGCSLPLRWTRGFFLHLEGKDVPHYSQTTE